MCRDRMDSRKNLSLKCNQHTSSARDRLSHLDYIHASNRIRVQLGKLAPVRAAERRAISVKTRSAESQHDNCFINLVDCMSLAPATSLCDTETASEIANNAMNGRNGTPNRLDFLRSEISKSNRDQEIFCGAIPEFKQHVVRNTIAESTKCICIPDACSDNRPT
jgi:hypothetical protein